MVSLIQSNYSTFGFGLVPARRRASRCRTAAACSRSRQDHPNVLAAAKASAAHDHPGVHGKGRRAHRVRHHGRWNQAQAHAQFVSNIADYGMTIQQALEAPRFTKGSFAGCDLDIEPTIAGGVLDSLTALGHKLNGNAAAIRHVRVGPGCDERPERRALGRVRTAARRRGHPAGRAGDALPRAVETVGPA